MLFYILLHPTIGYSVPRIIATINPIYSLVNAVTNGITKPVLLINEPVSIHDYMLKPSDKRKLKDSDIIFYVDDHLETFINKIQNKTLVKLSEVIELLPSRYDSNFSYKIHTTSNDLHIWLSPENAKNIVNQIKTVLCNADPENAEKYSNNANLALTQITKQTEKIKSTLSSVKTKPYIVTHDAYQYFEKYFGLNFIAALSSSHDTNISVKRLMHIKKIITQHKIKCIFSESSNDKVKNLFLKYQVKFQILDPIGNTLAAKDNAYFDIMQNIANNFLQCLSEE
ncbi:periplasmic solute binding family protein [Ehrlichia chaffeensis str. Heartland]|uniref:High-affinity zinc uptake system protein ZnuA n=1 Tax=Ehrlichia chaffeensis (strain ATCC CRL-10679 / Arkansas) TaxID=205920 RepID=Q2GFZ5_EHRCR|nr:metal ABC transporter substrate-binding protein [Ehrlichia chaffeensis]ABD44530.1 putative cation ABC transporter, periplasmic cation-binding protein [Ehrlichia chaffeensis str. Arkansas]AHX03892.1 periplasmic solute binding family protein [Ehrlichia chaffeensis str. Heartland]AHX05382.1 periplasmic solute binding family protein [Ehrlichia chaffeensis str. Jax]AHX06368.1 periplasmic solute binding family protein [Ehrlichia chaffeensis str. Liberty]AHX07658.1 periplasmic solute binding famil